ncbi:MAG: GntR family transcriptional regulator, partial [Phycisphaerae bacterium]|nr:GntR family transcriptional regulator [Phycisphaerae bacterium]
MPSERELAERFSVGRNTVLQALRSLADEGLIYRIPSKGTFVAGRKRSRTNQIGLIIPSVAEAFHTVFIKAIETVYARKFTVALANIETNFTKMEKSGARLIEQRVDGVIFVPLMTDLQEEQLKIRQIAERFTEAGIPVVFLDCHPGFGPKGQMPIPWDSVTSDNREGGYQITRFLLNLGHERIGSIRASMISSIFERLAGYRQALEKAGITYDEELIRIAPTEKDIDNCVEELLRLARPPTAIFAQCDGIARVVMQSLTKRGIDVPKEISVAGFDDLDYAKYLPVPLTTVHQQLTKMGQIAAELLIDRILGTTEEPQHIILPVRLVRRKSCTVPPHISAR